MYKTGNKGFTLIEQLVVLLIIGLVLIIFQLGYDTPLQTKVEEKIFFDKLQNNLNYAHEVALVDGRGVHVLFNTNRQVIYFKSYTGSFEEILELPEPWRLDTQLNLFYLPSGRVNRFGSVRFSNYENGDFAYLRFQLGNGRYELQKK